MIKSLIAACAAMLVFGAAVAHADPVDDAIDSYSFIAGMNAYLHTLRGIYPGLSVDDTGYEVAVAGFYCWPAAPFNSVPKVQWRDAIGGAIHDNAVAYGASESAVAAQMSVLNAYCAAYPVSPFPA